MKNFKSILKRVSAFALAAASAVVFMAGCGKTTPMETIENGAKELADNISENYSVIKTLNDAANGGSIEIRLSLADILSQAVGMELDIGASLKTFFGEDDAALQVAADFKGVNLVDVVLYENKEGVAVKSDVLTDGEAYGILFDDLGDKLVNSEFAEGGAFELPLEGGSMGEFVEMLSKVSSAMGMYGDINELLPVLKTDIYTAIEENSVNSVEKGTYDAADTTVKTNNVNIVCEDDQIVDMVKAVLDVLSGSEELKAFCEKHDEVLCLMFTVDNAYDAMTEALDEAKENVEESRGEMDGCKIEINAYVGISSKELVGLELELTGGEDSDDVEMKFVCAPSSDELKEVVFEMTADDYTQTVTYEVTEDTKSAYEAKLCASDSDGVDVTALEYSWNRENGDYELVLGADSAITVAGNIEAGDKKSTVTIESVAAGSFRMEFEELAIIINASDKMPVIETFTEILTMSEEEIGEMLDTVIGNVEDIIKTLA